MLAEQTYGQHQSNTPCSLQNTRPCVDQSRKYKQASDFMNDEEGVQELCKQAARWLFGSLPIPDQASDQAASHEHGAPIERRIQVR